MKIYIHKGVKVALVKSRDINQAKGLIQKYLEFENIQEEINIVQSIDIQDEFCEPKIIYVV